MRDLSRLVFFRKRCFTAWLRHGSGLERGGLCAHRRRRPIPRIHERHYQGKHSTQSHCHSDSHSAFQTFALPGAKISKTQDRLWYLVKEAQEAALKAGNEGASGRDVDAAARDLIKARGKRQAESEGFTHRLGKSLDAHTEGHLV